MKNSMEPDGPGRRGSLSQLDDGIAAARAGEKARAREILRRIIHNTPENEDAWLWLSWVAEDQAEGLRLLEEAQAFLPDSARIAEAVRWVRQELGLGPADALRPTAAPPADARIGIERRAAQVGEAARAAQQSASEALGRFRRTVRAVRATPIPWERYLRIIVPAGTLLATAVLCYLVMLGITSFRRGVQAVALPDLPTPVLDATATPSVKQRIEPLRVQMEVAFNQQDWDGAIDALEQIRAIDPRNDEARQRLAQAHYARSMARIAANKLDEARADLDQAIRLDAANEDLQKARVLLKTYLTGVDAYWVKDWPRVAENLQKVYDANPNFKDAAVMLAQAHYEMGVEKQGKKDWNGALESLQTALKLMPEMTNAQAHLDEVKRAITPPKRIEVSLAKQTMTVYDGDQPPKVFTICTGRPGTPTVPGRYEVQSKMPLAYASKWDINMPWWLGIYWAGGTENGFHALPVTQGGVVLWGDRLGRPCSYGCIVLATEDAKWLYSWADIGTVAFVNP